MKLKILLYIQIKQPYPRKKKTKKNLEPPLFCVKHQMLMFLVYSLKFFSNSKSRITTTLNEFAVYPVMFFSNTKSCIASIWNEFEFFLNAWLQYAINGFYNIRNACHHHHLFHQKNEPVEKYDTLDGGGEQASHLVEGKQAAAVAARARNVQRGERSGVELKKK